MHLLTHPSCRNPDDIPCPQVTIMSSLCLKFDRHECTVFLGTWCLLAIVNVLTPCSLLTLSTSPLTSPVWLHSCVCSVFTSDCVMRWSSNIRELCVQSCYATTFLYCLHIHVSCTILSLKWVLHNWPCSIIWSLHLVSTSPCSAIFLDSLGDNSNCL
jgi:hypothetical protein